MFSLPVIIQIFPVSVNMKDNIFFGIFYDYCLTGCNNISILSFEISGRVALINIFYRKDSIMGTNDVTVNQTECLKTQAVTEALLSMEKKVSFFSVMAGLRSNRTGAYCDGLPKLEGWFESKQQAEFAYCSKFPQVVNTDMRGVWELKTVCTAN
jgi:hypothetical protein